MSMTFFRRRLLITALFALLAAAQLCSTSSAHAEEAENWKLMLQRNYEELQYQIEYVDGVSQTLPGMVKQTRQDLASLRKKLDELMVLGRVSGGNPMELRAVLAGLDILQARVEAVTQPFQKADSDLKRFQERLGELDAEFSQQAAEGPSPELNKSLGDFLGDLRKLKNKLGRVKTVLDQGLNPTRDLTAGIGRSVQTVKERIPRAWKDYYFASGKSLLSLGAWQEAIQHMGNLPRYVATFANLFDAGDGRTKDLLTRLLGLMLVLVGGAAVVLKRLEKRFGGFRAGRPLGSLAWIGAGVGVLWATAGAGYVLVRAETGALAEVLISRGVLGLAWFLHLLRCGGLAGPAAKPETELVADAQAEQGGYADQDEAEAFAEQPDAACEGVTPPAGADAPVETAPEASAEAQPVAEAKPAKARRPKNPVGLAWGMFTLAVLLQMPWLPDAFRGGAWVLALFAAGWLVRRGAPRRGADAVSRLAGAGGWLYPLLCLPALFGWVNLTMLAAEGWFMALVLLQAGLALYGLVGRLAARPSADFTGEVLRSLAGGLALPLTVIAMAGCFLFWLSLAMGGSSVFLSAVSSDVGGEGFSLDLWRLAVIFIGFYLARAATRVADRLIAELPVRRPDLERGVLNLLETISTYVVWGLYVLIALRLAGANFTSLAVVAGGLSVGIGFGLQNIINNFISGLILLFGRSVQAGDMLQIGETWGKVQRVNIRNTVVQTLDNATLFVPNSDLIAQKIINWSHKDRRVRRLLEVGVAYGSDTALVQRLLLEAASSHPNVLAEPKPIVYFIAFADSSLNFRLGFWVNDLDNAARTSSDIHLAVDRAFRENGVEIPFPQRDVNVKMASGSEASPPFSPDKDGGRT
ncbi:mechanosensitive ion channel domain-containing protein [Fundidesulfovibrio agrisoli]|uniref:mechanosensitive ion channel domain-containing protein n=1 Tax=Fundidesulfovibrio agrisoli TaxID=2922717 RepID=UPI001FADA447|nr:mechanosensitive ion channel domain-containing protein [Fundidesulfovibrio agrisoli]